MNIIKEGREGGRGGKLKCRNTHDALNMICRIRVSIVPRRCNRKVTIGSRQPKHFRSDVMADLDNNFLLCSTEREGERGREGDQALACGEAWLKVIVELLFIKHGLSYVNYNELRRAI